MPFHRQNRATVTKTTKPTLMSRLRGRNARTQTVKTTTTVTPNHGHGAGHHNHHTTGTGTTTTGRRSRWGRSNRTSGTTTGVHHHKRHASFGDKISGAMLRLRGSLTGRPGVKAAGTRRMNGTDGRGSHRGY